MRRPIPKRISQILPTFQNVAQTSHYSVQFSLPNSSLKGHLRAKGVDTRFTLEKIGLLCAGAALPGSSLANVQTQGDYQGVVEQMAHTRIFTQMSLDFYVDNEYKSMKFLEHWMEFITGAISDPADDTYFYQLHYPSEYKSNDTRIVKFERNYKQFLEYRFIGLFPLSLNSTRVSYQGSQVLKASCSFSFDRYVCGESTSLARDLKRAYNEIFNRGNVARDGTSVLSNTLNRGTYVQRAGGGGDPNVQSSITGRTSVTTNVAGQQLPGTGTNIGTRIV